MMRYIRCVVIALILLAGCDSQGDKEDSRCQGWRLDYVAELDKILENDHLSERAYNNIRLRANGIADRMRNAGCEGPPGLIL